MDLVTQIVLGAAVGQFGYQRVLKRRAIAYGALAGLVPDLDIIVKLFSDPYSEILYHRGITHSLFFGPVVGPFLGYLLWRMHGKQLDHLKAWIGLMIASLLTHPLLDFFTVYGTQLLSPFSNHRFGISGVAVVDPFYTIPLMLSILVGLLCAKRLRLSCIVSGITLLFTTAYLFIGVAINDRIFERVTEQLERGHAPFYRLNVYTTLLQLPLRRVVVHTEDEVGVGFLSYFDKGPIQWAKQKKAEPSLLRKIIHTRDYQIFSWFCNNDMCAMAKPLGADRFEIVVTDLRYGGWDETTFGLWGLHTVVNSKGDILQPIKKAGINRTGFMKGSWISEIFTKAFSLTEWFLMNGQQKKLN